MIEFLLTPLNFDFMIKAFIIITIISFPTALLSCFLVLKGWSLMGDAISHAVLPGIVIAYIVKLPLIIGAFLAGLFCSTLSGFIYKNSRIKQDTVLGIVFSGMFGLGIILITKTSTNLHLDHILFGNILGISSEDLILNGSISAIVALILIIKRKDLMLYSFDEVQANALGLKINFLNYLLLSMISLTVVSTLSSVGIILSIGLLITPGAIVYLITKEFEKMLFFSVLITSFSGFMGVYLSFFINSAPAPTVIMILTIIFLIVLLFNVLRKRINQKRI